MGGAAKAAAPVTAKPRRSIPRIFDTPRQGGPHEKPAGRNLHMKLFDEDGNYIGEFFAATKEKVEDSFEDSWIWGLFVLLIIAPGWLLFGLIIWGIFKILKLIVGLLFKLLLLLVRCIWWLVRLPICLIFYHEFPKFN